MANLTTFRTNLAGMIGSLDVTDSADLARMDGWINEGYQDVLMRTSCTVVADTTPLSAGTADYTISSAVIKVVGITLTAAGTDYELARYTPNQILAMRRNTTALDIPFAFAVAGGNLLMLYPTPVSSGSLTLYYVPLPTNLVTGTDQPTSVPVEWHKLIEYYAYWRAADYDDDLSSQQGERYRQNYENAIREYRRVIHQQGGSRPAPMRLRGTRAPASSDPSRSWH